MDGHTIVADGHIASDGDLSRDLPEGKRFVCPLVSRRACSRHVSVPPHNVRRHIFECNSKGNRFLCGHNIFLSTTSGNNN